LQNKFNIHNYRVMFYDNPNKKTNFIFSNNVRVWKNNLKEIALKLKHNRCSISIHG